MVRYAATMPLDLTTLLAALLAVAAPLTTPTAPAPSAPPPDPGSVRCDVVDAAHKTKVAMVFSYSNMQGTVAVDSPTDTRRLRVKAVPYAATYDLQFLGYDTGDKKPAGEVLKPGTSMVARMYTAGDTNHILFGKDSASHWGDVQIAAGTADLTCQ
jgi:hypothetical protein